ncbi:MAG: AMIN domain-containing protein [Desulfovibrionaceae bacterium]|nr:AMIN domain-containing protein [Desulfovibrionaceae bacterium]
MQQRTIFSIILGVAILSISLFLLNTWLDTNNEGIFLTQDTYVGTVTWYEDANTPPIPSELKKTSPLATPTQSQSVTSIASSDILGITTAAGSDSPPLLEPEIYDVTTGKFIQAPIEEKKESTTLPEATLSTTIAIEPPKEAVSSTPSVVKTTPASAPSSSVVKEASSSTEPNRIQRIFLTKDTKRPLRIEASHPITYKTFYLASPERIVIDIDGKLNISSVEKTIKQHALIKDVRIAYNGNNTRIVVDLVKKPKQWSVVYGQRKQTIDVSLQS